MLHHHHSPTAAATTTGQNHPTYHDMFYDELDMDSNCSTPYVSAPSSPGRNAPPPPPNPIPGFYYSAPSSPMHFIVVSAAVAPISPAASPASSTCSFEFDFSNRLITTIGTSSPPRPITMTSADELFFNGQIRPMNVIDDAPAPAPFPFDGDDEIGVANEKRGRAAKYRDRSRRRTRSMSPVRTMAFDWKDDFETEKNEVEMDCEGKGNDDGIESEVIDPTMTTLTTPESSGSSSSRSSSVGRGSKRWVILKEFLNRSKSEGRNNGNKFWGSLSFSPVKDKIKIEKLFPSKITTNNVSSSSYEKIDAATEADAKKTTETEVKKKKTVVNGAEKRRMRRSTAPSAHELHYTANRAQAEEMRKKTFLPYRQGLLGCLGFNSKSTYGAMNGFARTLNSVSSR